MRATLCAVSTFLVVLPACGASDGLVDSNVNPTAPAATDESGAADDGPSPAGDSGDDGTGTGADGPPGTEGGAESGDDGPGGFIDNPDGGGVTNECNQWIQDCPAGEKCMPWANDGGTSWNATRCTPLGPNPAQIGDTCTVEGSGVSGIDDCALGAMCFYVDPKTNTGNCVGMCLGTPDAPQCDPNQLCSNTNDGVLTLCFPECDPLLQDCVEGGTCVFAYGSEGFGCSLDASGSAGLAGEPCEYINVCALGLFCADAATVPNCAGAIGCCSEYCDLTAPDPSAACTFAADGQECLPWFEEGTAPPDYEHVGACVLPT